MKSSVLSRIILLTILFGMISSGYSVLFGADSTSSMPYASVRISLLAQILYGDSADQQRAKTVLVKNLRRDEARSQVVSDIDDMLTKLKQGRSIKQLRAETATSDEALSSPRRRHDLAELLIDKGKRFAFLVAIIEEESLFELSSALVDGIDVSISLGIENYPIEEHFPVYAALKRMNVETSVLIDGIEVLGATPRGLLGRLLVEKLGKDGARISILQRLEMYEKANGSSSEAREQCLRECLVQIGHY